MSEQEIWDKVLNLSKEEVSNISYQTWLKDTMLHTLSDEEAIVLVNQPFVASWLSTNYTELIQTIIKTVTGKSVKHVRFF